MCIRDSSKAHVCNICPTQNQCSALHKKSGQHIIHRSWDQELFEQEINRMKEPIFHRKLRERMWKIEGIFSEAKNIHGLSRAKYRGLQKMQIQAHMTSATQNLKRLITRLISTFITALLQHINFEFWKFMICIIKYKISNSFFYIRGIKYI